MREKYIQIRTDWAVNSLAKVAKRCQYFLCIYVKKTYRILTLFICSLGQIFESKLLLVGKNTANAMWGFGDPT